MFVNCILGAMESQTIWCDPAEVKNRLGEQTYSYMPTYWDYSENCKRKPVLSNNFLGPVVQSIVSLTVSSEQNVNCSSKYNI